MKIFLPFKEDLNPYLKEIEACSANTFVYDHYKQYSTEYKIVNIHWPEAIFDWWEPTLKELNDLEKEINLWKRNSLLVYTKHDYQRNKGTTPLFNRLFELIERSSDVFIHLGEYSREQYQEKYPDAVHKIIPHPLYKNSYVNYSKEQARAKLGIVKDAFVITASGAIRSYSERKLVFDAFKLVEKKKKVLISTKMRSEIKLEFRGRLILKNLIDVKKILINRFKRKYAPPKYLFSYERLNSDDFSLRIAAADLILIPRLNILNSGNVFLAYTFKKVVVGPGIGNIKESLQKYHMPVFDPFSRDSLKMAIDQGVRMCDSSFKFEDSLFEDLRPSNVAKLMDKVFSDLLN